jgi:hypothetical protein
MPDTLIPAETLFRPVLIGLRMGGRGEYIAIATINSRMGLGVFASCIEWSLVTNLDEFVIRARLAEYADEKRVPQGRSFGRTICKVQRGSGDHSVHIRNRDGTVSVRIISADEVVSTVRLFLSVACIRHRLDMVIVEAEQLGISILRNAVQMIVRPVSGN